MTGVARLKTETSEVKHEGMRIGGETIRRDRVI